MKFLPHLERLAAIAVSSNGRVVAVAGQRDFEGATTSTIHLYRWPKLQPAGAIEADGSVSALAFLEGELLVAGTARGTLLGVDASRETPAVLFRDRAHASAIRALAASTTGNIVASTGDDGIVRVCRLEVSSGTATLKLLGARQLSSRPILSLAIDPGGAQVVAGGEDGVVRVLPVATLERAEIREMSAGEAPIRALELLGDGRVAAATAEGALKYLFLEGAVDEEDRSKEHAHRGPIRGLVRSPLLLDEADRELPRRVYTVGEDGELKSWQLETKRRPRTFELGAGPLHAIVWVPAPPRAAKDKRGGTLLVVGRERKLLALKLDGSGDLPENPEREELGSELDRLAEDRAARGAPVREAAIRALGAIPEDEARVLLEQSLLEESQVELRVLAAETLGATHRRQSRPALRAAIGEKRAFEPFSKQEANRLLRKAALEALLGLDRATPLLPLKAALESVHEDVRSEAVARLPALRKSSPLVPGLIAERLSDRSVNVRLLALDALVESEPKGSLEPLVTALARGEADVRLQAIVYLGAFAQAKELLERSLDDANEAVRSIAFVVLLAQRPALAAKLRAIDPRLHSSLVELEKSGFSPISLPGEDKEVLFAALASHHADSAVRAARSLALLQDARAVGALLQLSREAEVSVRTAATAALLDAARAMPGDDRARLRLEWLLDDEAKEVRAAAYAALAELHLPLALARLVLSTAHEDIRQRALAILFAEKRSEESEQLLANALDDEAENVRQEAFRTLWAWHPKDARIPLERGAISRHADVRARVVHELARQKGPWARLLLISLVKDATSEVALAAYRALTQDEAEKKRVDAHIAAMASLRADVRAAGARGSIATNNGSAVKNSLLDCLRDERPLVHLAAIEAADLLLTEDEVPFAIALGSIFYELRVRAGELLGYRKNTRAVAAMKELLSIPRTRLDRPSDDLRRRAARALADAGDPTAIPYLQGLLEDEDPIVREMGGRGLATACRPGEVSALVAALAHPDLPVRSWAAEGLARFGDLRALPVLAGTQHHDHRPLRMGAILGFVALGADGVRGILQGLADRDREIQDLVFAIIAARDRALVREGHAPDLLLTALASRHPELRFASARMLESRFDAADYEAIAKELVGPKKPEKAADLKKWPSEEKQRALINLVVEALASDDPAKRYASAQVLSLRSQPEAYFEQAERLRPTSADKAWVPHAGGAEEKAEPRRTGWIRRLFGKKVKAPDPLTSAAARVLTVIRFRGATNPQPVPSASEAFSRAEALQLAFGTYAGLVRQAPESGAADETHRIRRDSIDRLAQLAKEPALGSEAVLPVVRRALSDPHYLVRRSGMNALIALYPANSLEPLSLALASSALDLGRTAVDELVTAALAGNEAARALAKSAIEAPNAEVRAHALGRLEKLSPKGSLEPWLFALESRYADVRSAVVDRLLGSDDPRVQAALSRAMESDHEDLRLKAAAALARRKVAAAIDVLAPFLRSEDVRVANDALEALIALKTARAAEAIAQRLEDDPDKTADRTKLINAIARIADPAGAPVLIRALEDEQPAIRGAALRALWSIALDKKTPTRVLGAQKHSPHFQEALALEYVAAAARSPHAELRLDAAKTLNTIEDREAEAHLSRLLGDREAEVRVAAAEAVAYRASVFASATIEPLRAVLKQGRRELVLPAALGLAAKKRPEAFQPLLLVFKAGEGVERERALLGLGMLGDRRALAELLPLLDPHAELSDEERALVPAIYEALGAMLPSLRDLDEQAKVRDLVERTAKNGAPLPRARAITGLRHAADDRSRAVLENIAADPFAEVVVRGAAVEQLGHLAHPSSEAVLGEALSATGAMVRDQALEALKKLFPNDPTRVNLLALSSTWAPLSDSAALFLAKHGDPQLLVKRLAEIKSPDARRRLRLGLVRRGLCPKDQVEALLRAEDAGARAEAAWMAGAAGEGALAGAVKASLERAEAGYQREANRPGAKQRTEAEAWRAGFWAASTTGADAQVSARTAATNAELPAPVRAEAIRFLARHGRKEDAVVLQPVLGDRAEPVRAAAAEAIAKLHPTEKALSSTPAPDAARMAPMVRPLLASAQRSLLATPVLRHLVLPVAIGDGALELLAAQAKAKGKGVERLAAIAALGRMGTREAVAVLKAILADAGEDTTVRAATYRAMRRAERALAKVYAEGVDKEKRGFSGGGAFASSFSEEEAEEPEPDEDDEPEEEDEDFDGDEEEGEDDE